MKRIIIWTGVVALLLTCSPAVWAQGQAAAPKKSPGTPGYVQEIDIAGKISQEAGGYVIVGQQPREIYLISNPEPQALDKLAQSGQIVRIKARIVLGDNVAIEKINGKPYPGEGEGKAEKK